MPVLDASHDLAHPVESDGAWSESYYFNCYDPDTDSGFFTRIGIRPNEGSMDVGHSLWLPGGNLAVIYGKVDQSEMIDTGMEVAGVKYERLEPMKSWKITADSKAAVIDLTSKSSAGAVAVKMDVSFEALTPAIGVDGQVGAEGTDQIRDEARKSVGKGHLEQAGGWSGWIELDGERFELQSARGNRDKSWGPRQWAGPRMWRWFSINFGDDVHLGGIRIGTDAGDLHRGWIWRDGRHSSIDHWDVRTELEEDGITHKSLVMDVTDREGRVHEIAGEVMRIAPIPRTHAGVATLLNEGLTRFEYEGLTGYGIAEYLHRLGDDGKPVSPIA